MCSFNVKTGISQTQIGPSALCSAYTWNLACSEHITFAISSLITCAIYELNSVSLHRLLLFCSFIWYILDMLGLLYSHHINSVISRRNLQIPVKVQMSSSSTRSRFLTLWKENMPMLEYWNLIISVMVLIPPNSYTWFW